MNDRATTLLCLALSLFPCAAAAQPSKPIVQFGEEHTLHSKTLGEDRTYWVCTPPSYQLQDNQRLQKYPVLYLLDAEWNFQWASQVVQFMSESSQIPEMIVVGVPNRARDKDLTPTQEASSDSSGGPRFEEFLSEELAPAIDAEFRTAPYRILMGHSMGGALACDAFLRQSHGFQAYVAIDPSLWWDHEKLLQRAQEFAPQKDSHAALFIAMADWPRSLDQKAEMIGSSERFVAALKGRGSSDVRIGYQRLEAEDHSSSRLPGLYNGLRFVFAGYKPIDLLALGDSGLIEDHFKELSDRLGFQFLPPERLVTRIGYALLEAKHPDKAVACFKLNVTNYPTSAYAYSHLADALLANGEKQSAIENYKKALELNPNVDGVKQALKKLKS